MLPDGPEIKEQITTNIGNPNCSHILIEFYNAIENNEIGYGFECNICGYSEFRGEGLDFIKFPARAYIRPANGKAVEVLFEKTGVAFSDTELINIINSKGGSLKKLGWGKKYNFSYLASHLTNYYCFSSLGDGQLIDLDPVGWKSAEDVRIMLEIAKHSNYQPDQEMIMTQSLDDATASPTAQEP